MQLAWPVPEILAKGNSRGGWGWVKTSVPASHFQSSIYLPRKFLHPPAVDPRTQLPWWMVTSHLWAVLSSRASGVRLQISTLSKCTWKSSNFILSERHGKEQAVIHFSEARPAEVLTSQSPGARSPAHVDLNSFSDLGDMLTYTRGQASSPSLWCKTQATLLSGSHSDIPYTFLFCAVTVDFIQLQLGIRWKEVTLAQNLWWKELFHRCHPGLNGCIYTAEKPTKGWQASCRS